MKMNLGPAYRYQFKSLLKGSAVFYLIMAVIITAFLAVTVNFGGSSSTNFGGYGISVAIYMFVIGIVYIRSDLRLCLQFGVSRRTAFLSEMLSLLSISALLAIAGELVTALIQAVASGNPNIFVFDFYQLIYLGTDRVLTTFGQHIMSALTNTSLFFCACTVGIFFSLLFWRLNKLWTIVVAILIPFAINGVPYLLIKLGVDFKPFFAWIASSPFCFILTCLVIAAAAAVIDWLLLRRANIKAAKN